LIAVEKKIKFVKMEVFKHIKQLLYRYECVILPGFGAFITRSHSAVIQADGTLIPPGKTVFFNRQLQTNDGLLAHHLAHAEGITYALALEKIRLFSARLIETLEQKAFIDCAPLGHFDLVEQGVLRFEATEQMNLAIKSFGLTSVLTHPIIRAESNTPVIPIRSTKNRLQNVWKYAAVGLIALSLGGYGATYRYNQSVLAYNESLEVQAQAYVQEQIQQATFSPNIDLGIISITLEAPKGPYHIVAGAFRIEENASRKVAMLKNQGYSARVIGQNKYGLHQVAFASYADRSEALSALSQIRAKQNKEAWLLVQ
jgi:hypothetical protein